MNYIEPEPISIDKVAELLRRIEDLEKAFAKLQDANNRNTRTIAEAVNKRAENIEADLTEHIERLDSNDKNIIDGVNQIDKRLRFVEKLLEN